MVSNIVDDCSFWVEERSKKPRNWRKIERNVRANPAITAPIWKLDAPKSRTYKGRTGTIMENAIATKNVITHIQNKERSSK